MRTVMLAFALLAAASTSSAQDGRWLQVSVIPGMKITYLDTATLVRDGVMVTFWTKARFPGNERDQMTQYRVDCRQNVLQVLQEADHFPNGTTTVLIAAPQTPRPVVAGSAGAKMAAEACSRAR